MKIFSLALGAAVGLIISLLGVAQSSAAESAALRFVPSGDNEFAFDTGVLRGKLRGGGKSAGLSSVVHIPTGIKLDASMGLFSHYRLFTANKRYGTAGWDLPSEAKLAPDGSVAVRWAASPDRPFELSAVYRWAAPNVLDLETGVLAKTNLFKFESFLASYFSSPFTNASVWTRASGESRFLPADRSAGVWLAFPRDDAAVSIIQDGRWKIEPNPVDWVIMPRLAEPVAFRRCPANGLTAVILSPPEDAFAILTPFQTEPHYSTYLSLFGRDFKAGESARARARLVIGANLTERDILKLRQEFSSR
jgi:hypothetical protein